MVRRCHEIMSGNDVAVKFVNRRKQGEAETLREYRHLAQLNHPHIISSLGLALLMFLGLAVRIKLKDSLWISLPALFYMTLNAYIFLEAINYQQFF